MVHIVAETDAGDAQQRPERPSAAEISAGLAFVKALPRKELRAFLALFAGARFPWTTYDGERAAQAPFMGKAECEWVDDWRDFYGTRLKDAGLFHFAEGESGDALGMVLKPDGSFHRWTRIECGPTDLGWLVREAWWAELTATDAREERAPIERNDP